MGKKLLKLQSTGYKPDDWQMGSRDVWNTRAQKNSHQSDTAVFRMQEDLFRTHHRGVNIQDM